MPHRKGRIGDTGGLRFFGKIVSGQSHELTNVLTIINELVGLQVDKVRALARPGAGDAGSIEQISGKIQNQVRRGEEIIRSINRFAHSVDTPVALLDVREALSSIVFLTERWARLKKIRLLTDFPGETVALETDPFAFAQIVFWCLEAALSTARSQKEITVAYRVQEGGVEIVVRSADGMSAGGEGGEIVPLLRTLIDHLGGDLQMCFDRPGGGRIVLFVPRERTEGSADVPGR